HVLRSFPTRRSSDLNSSSRTNRMSRSGALYSGMVDLRIRLVLRMALFWIFARFIVTQLQISPPPPYRCRRTSSPRHAWLYGACRSEEHTSELQSRSD